MALTPNTINATGNNIKPMKPINPETTVTLTANCPTKININTQPTKVVNPVIKSTRDFGLSVGINGRFNLSTLI